jgi:hypothetical protein
MPAVNSVLQDAVSASSNLVIMVEDSPGWAIKT